MSALVEKAIGFYLGHPEVVEEVEAGYGRTHQVHICPECNAAMVLRDGKMVSLKSQPTVVEEELPLLEEKTNTVAPNASGQLLPC